MTEMLTVPEAARIIGVSEWVTTQLLESGDMEGYKVRSSWRMTREQVESYLEAVRNSSS